MALRGEALHIAHRISEIKLKTEATCMIEFLQVFLQTRDISATLLLNPQSLYTRTVPKYAAEYTR
jgi:hypothetical protein